MKEKILEKVIGERDALHSVIHTFVAEFQILKDRINELEKELKDVANSVIDAQLDLDLPQKKP